MTPEQKDKLETRRALLIDVLIDEADPTKFYTMDTREGRGDRNWQKTNAIKTATLIMRIEDLIGKGVRQLPATPGEEAEDGDDAAVIASQKEVDRLIREAGEKVAKIGGKKRAAKG